MELDSYDIWRDDIDDAIFDARAAAEMIGMNDERFRSVAEAAWDLTPPIIPMTLLGANNRVARHLMRARALYQDIRPNDEVWRKDFLDRCDNLFAVRIVTLTEPV